MNYRYVYIDFVLISFNTVYISGYTYHWCAFGIYDRWTLVGNFCYCSLGTRRVLDHMFGDNLLLLCTPWISSKWPSHAIVMATNQKNNRSSKRSTFPEETLSRKHSMSTCSIPESMFTKRNTLCTTFPSHLALFLRWQEDLSHVGLESFLDATKTTWSS